ncbi:MAG TPA: hypothetical protein VFC09_05160 [Candidatus Dormibacteraeota bacterium]|nr:hypothetical protein [Candidatus Dormibacteraeota bacterium]
MLSRLLVPALLRPVGEHLVATLDPHPGEVCAYLPDDEDVLPSLLARTGATCDELTAATPAGSAQVVASLFAPLTTETVHRALRALDPHRGRLACALTVALPGVTLGGGLPILSRPGVTLTRIRDVARFDGAAHYAAATGVDAGEALQPFVAVDGTVRIPVEVVVLRAGPPERPDPH